MNIDSTSDPKYLLFLFFVLTIIFAAPVAVLIQYLRRVFDRQGMPIKSISIESYIQSNAPIIGFAGAYDFQMEGKMYFAEFSINGNDFKEIISQDTYFSSKPIEVMYVVGKSGKIYINKIS